MIQRPTTISKLLPLLLTLAVWPSSALYAKNDKVIELTQLNFQSKVLKSPDVWMVEFFAPWCGHCKNLAPAYKKLAEKMQGIVRIGAVNCEEQQSICGQYGIQGFPTIKVFLGDKTGSQKKPTDYQGARSLKPMADYVVSMITDKYVTRLKQSVEFGEKGKPRVMLLSDKSIVPPLFKSLSLSYQKDFSFASCKPSEPFAKQKLAGVKAPAVLLFPDDSDENFMKYEGELKAMDLRRWLVDFKKGDKKSSTGGDDSNEDSEEPAGKVKEEPFDPVVYHVANQTVFDEQCVQAAAKYPSSFCVLSFLPPLEEEFEESIKQHREFIGTLSELKKDLYEAQKSDSPLPRVSVLWLDGSVEENHKLLQRFGVGTDLPSVVFVKPDKKIVGPYLGGFEKTSMIKGVKEAAKGRGRFFKYSFDISITATKSEADQSSESSCGSESGSDSDDSGQCTAPPKSHDEF